MKKVIAIDIGGTKINGAIISDDAKILKILKEKTKARNGVKNIVDTLFGVIDNLMENENIMCISIGSAGRINIKSGSVFYASDNLPGWTGINLKNIVEDKYNIYTIVENDCKVAGYGEEWVGNAKGCKSYVNIVLGTGVGGAAKVDGNMIHGVHWSAAELGHMIIHPNGRQCNCGLKGCLEQYCSGPALVKQYNEISNHFIHNGYDFFELVKLKDNLAISILEEFVDNLFVVIQTLYNIYDPDKILIGGGLIDTKEYWWEDLQLKICSSPLNDIFKLCVEPAKLGNYAALYGAAYLAFKHLSNA